MSKFRSSYHNHTARCHHARGVDEDYVKEAIKGGFKVFGFADHAPHHYPEGYVSSVRMTIPEMMEYSASVKSLKEKYRDEIDIKLGVEMEYIPAYFERDIAYYRSLGVEYLLLGQHTYGTEGVGTWWDSFRLTDSEERLKTFTNQCIEGIESGLYSAVVHPDLFNFGGDVDLLRSEYDRLILAAKKNDVPLELNLLGLSEGRHYPNRIFWERVAKNSHVAVIGRDAHSPDRVAKLSEEEMAIRFAEEIGFELIEQIRLGRI